MANAKYTAGRAAEYQIRDLYKERGFKVVRSAGSKTKIDLVALHKCGVVIAIQVKRIKKGTQADVQRLVKEFLTNLPMETKDTPIVQMLHVKLNGKWQSTSVGDSRIA